MMLTANYMDLMYGKLNRDKQSLGHNVMSQSFLLSSQPCRDYEIFLYKLYFCPSPSIFFKRHHHLEMKNINWGLPNKKSCIIVKT